MPDPTPPYAIEQVWLVEATYAPDAAAARAPYRVEHLTRMAKLKRRGVIVEVGALADVSASVALVRADSEEQALEVCRQDVYFRNGVWGDLRARAFGRVVAEPAPELASEPASEPA